MSILGQIKSSLYKLYHSPLFLIHILVPFAAITLFIWYYSFSPWDEGSKLYAYIQIISVTFPTIIGLITSILATEQQKAGHFQILLSTPLPKYVPHLTFLLWLLLFGFCSSLLTIVGFGFLFRQLLGYTTYSLIFYVKTAILLSISVIPLYLIHYLISFIFGVGYSTGLGIIGSLLSALLLTGLGEGIWSYLPWGINARFSGSLYVSHTMNIDFLALSGMIQSILYILISTLILLIILITATKAWDGRKSEDE